jgi:dipeptidyl aminopeptidase/acylaminoacyl peptidase
MKIFLIVLIIITAPLAVYGVYRFINSSTVTNSPLAPYIPEPIIRTLDPYNFDNLIARVPEPSQIILEEVLVEDEEFTAHLFSYQTENKRVTGQINLPTGYETKKSPIIFMNRGYVSEDIYQTGIGTRSAAAVYARNGYITIAPDYLGFGGSDPSDDDQFLTRVRRPVTAIDLLASIKELDYVDANNIFMWGHSNGGQISLSILEITGESIPTTLWAPVSKPFPYSVLYYTDDYDDLGKALRKSLANFESIYNADLYSIHHYLDRINAPIQIHQGGRDSEIPLEWSDELADNLRELEDENGDPRLEITYYTYPLADHDLRPNWDTVVARDLEFFNQNLK